MTVRNTKGWYSDQGGRGVPPIVHYLALSNLAWLKKPALAAGLKLHELVALCSAALRPSNAAWQRFIDQLRALEASEEITSDEITAVIASDLTERLLIEEEIDEDSDATSVTEVIERVKASYKQESDAAVSLARDSAARAAADAEAIRTHASQRTRGLARAISWVVVVALGLSFIAGTALSVVCASGGSAPSVVACVLAVGPLAVAGLLGVLWGFHLPAPSPDRPGACACTAGTQMHTNRPLEPVNVRGSEGRAESAKRRRGSGHGMGSGEDARLHRARTDRSASQRFVGAGGSWERHRATARIAAQRFQRRRSQIAARLTEARPRREATVT